MFDKAMKKSIEPYLQPGEELLDAIIVQGKGMTKWLVGGGAIGQAAAGAMRDRKSGAAAAENEGGVELASKMGIAVTSGRLLIYKAGGAMTLKAKELLTDVPISDVDSVSVGKAALTKPVTISVRGEEFHVEAPKASKPDKFVAAFERAKAGSAAPA
jgi:hypothetical protein